MYHLQINLIRTCDAFAIVLHFVAVHAHLVTSDDGLEAIVLAETLGDVGAELHADASLAGSSAGLVLRIGPQHLHHQARLTGLALCVSVQLANVVQRDLIIGE